MNGAMGRPNRVTLSKFAVASTVATYWGEPGFPNDIFIALEADVGFGAVSGGVAIGSVVNTLHDTEGGSFFTMACIDELVLNIPKPDDALAWLRQTGRLPEGAKPSRRQELEYLNQYRFLFAEQASDFLIDWEP